MKAYIPLILAVAVNAAPAKRIGLADLKGPIPISLEVYDEARKFIKITKEGKQPGIYALPEQSTQAPKISHSLYAKKLDNRNNFDCSTLHDIQFVIYNTNSAKYVYSDEGLTKTREKSLHESLELKVSQRANFQN